MAHSRGGKPVISTGAVFDGPLACILCPRLHMASRRTSQPYCIQHINSHSKNSTPHPATVAAAIRNSISSSSSSQGPHPVHRRNRQCHSQHLTEPTDAVTLSGPGLPLLLGLKQLPAGAESLVGWRALLHSNRTVVGTVRQVHSIQGAYHLLRVYKDSILQPHGFQGREVHSIPLVPDIVARIYPQQKVLTITPPTGLLDLGRRELLLSFLSSELQQYTTPLPHPAGVSGQPLMGIRCMPTQRQLVEAGRSDLVGLIGKVGGFTEAALLLGLRATRRPAGYWDSLEVLDAELDSFVAGSWVALPAESDNEQQLQGAKEQADADQQYYFYNMATRSISWELPAAARALLPSTLSTQITTPSTNTSTAGSDSDDEMLDDELLDDDDPEDVDLEDLDQNFGPHIQQQQQREAGGLSSRALQRALMSLADEKIMPSRSAIAAAGRWDLDTAIRHNGGYREVAQMLNRRPSWPVPKTLTNLKALASALAELAADQGWDAGVLPTLRQLEQTGRDDIIKAIAHHGGWGKAANLLKLRLHRRQQTQVSSTAHSTAAAVLEFMAVHPPPGGSSSSGSSSSSSRDSTGSSITATSKRLFRVGAQVLQGAAASRSAGEDASATAAAGTAAATAAAATATPSQHGWTELPTQRQLLAAGRLDILYGLRKHGCDTVRALVGLPEPKRKKLRKGVLRWEAVEAAVRAGCHTAPAILEHITQQAKQAHQHQQHSGQQQPPPQQHPQPAEQQQQQQQADAVVSAGPPLVSHEHLRRQLKVWCDQGRLVKPRTGRYELPASKLQA